VKKTDASIKEKSKAIFNNSQEKAKTEIDFNRSNEGKEAVMLEFEQLSNCNAELHQSCDFVMKNFRITQNVCDEEIEAWALTESVSRVSDGQRDYICR